MTTESAGLGLREVDLAKRLTEYRRMVSLGYTQRFEEIAERFYQETGLFAPGKSVPLAMGNYDEGERNREWARFQSAQLKQYQADLDVVIESLAEVERLRAALAEAKDDAPGHCENCRAAVPLTTVHLCATCLPAAPSEHRAALAEVGRSPLRKHTAQCIEIGMMLGQAGFSEDIPIQEAVRELITRSHQNPPTDDERVPTTPRQVMAYRPVVTPVRAAPRFTADEDEAAEPPARLREVITKYRRLAPTYGVQEWDNLLGELEVLLSTPAQTPRVEARRDQPDGAEPHR